MPKKKNLQSSITSMGFLSSSSEDHTNVSSQADLWSGVTRQLPTPVPNFRGSVFPGSNPNKETGVGTGEGSHRDETGVLTRPPSLCTHCNGGGSVRSDPTTTDPVPKLRGSVFPGSNPNKGIEDGAGEDSRWVETGVPHVTHPCVFMEPESDSLERERVGLVHPTNYRPRTQFCVGLSPPVGIQRIEPESGWGRPVGGSRRG